MYCYVEVICLMLLPIPTLFTYVLVFDFPKYSIINFLLKYTYNGRPVVEGIYGSLQNLFQYFYYLSVSENYN